MPTFYYSCSFESENRPEGVVAGFFNLRDELQNAERKGGVCIEIYVQIYVYTYISIL